MEKYSGSPQVDANEGRIWINKEQYFENVRPRGFTAAGVGA